MTKKPKADYAIQAVANALRLLHVFREEDEIGVAELARRLDLPEEQRIPTARDDGRTRIHRAVPGDGAL